MIPLPVVAQLAEIFSRVPSPHCKGLCVEECRTLGDAVPALEQQLIFEATGKKMNRASAPTAEAFAKPCSLLVGGKCSVYAYRPLICRMYGVAEGLACPHGCKAESPLDDATAFGIIKDAIELSEKFQLL